MNFSKLHLNLTPRHCEECLVLNNCWFLKEKTPLWPHHPRCHCLLANLPYSEVLNNCSAGSSYSKFEPYLFNTKEEYSHNKEKLFKSWGYTVTDAKWLQNEIEKQGLEKYISGDYTLGKLNDKGQRISIRVEIPRKDKNSIVSFITGWMVYPDGYIHLITPYGGK